ncbi:hypothetical protein KQI65_07935 [bacterium]|nr:hypothetical protein [bacterium]
MRVGYVFPLLFLFLMHPMAAQYRLTPNPGSIPGASLKTPTEHGDAATDSLTAQLQPTAGEKLLYLAGAALGMGLFDYVGFNLVRDNDVTTPIYRVVQGLTQIGVSWLLYEKVGLPTAIAFNLVWWTWGLDALFYGYTELFNVGGSWRTRGTFNREVNANHVKWASWTPVGIAQGMDPDKAIAGDALIAQVLVGAALAVTITISL